MAFGFDLVNQQSHGGEAHDATVCSLNWLSANMSSAVCAKQTFGQPTRFRMVGARLVEMFIGTRAWSSDLFKLAMPEAA